MAQGGNTQKVTTGGDREPERKRNCAVNREKKDAGRKRNPWKIRKFLSSGMGRPPRREWNVAAEPRPRWGEELWGE